MATKKTQVLTKDEMQKIGMSVMTPIELPDKCRKSSFILKYNGKKTMELTDDEDSVSWVDNASGAADTASISLNNKTLKWLKGSWFPNSSDYIKMSIKVVAWKNMSDNRTAYCGKFYIDEIFASGYPSKVEISALSIPHHTGCNITQRKKTYKKTTLKKILQEIAKRMGVKLVYSAGNHSIKEISQDGRTDLEFAFSLCSDYDLSMKVYNDKLVVYNQTTYERRKSSFTLDKNDLGEEDSYHFTRSVSKIYNAVKFQYSDKNNKNIIYRYKVPKTSGSRVLFISSTASSHADAEHKAKAKLAENLRSAVKATFHVMGDPKYMACKVFTVKGFGKFDGRYFIDKVTHTKSDGYETTIDAHKCVTNIR